MKETTIRAQKFQNWKKPVVYLLSHMTWENALATSKSPIKKGNQGGPSVEVVATVSGGVVADGMLSLS